METLRASNAVSLRPSIHGVEHFCSALIATTSLCLERHQKAIDRRCCLACGWWPLPGIGLERSRTARIMHRASNAGAETSQVAGRDADTLAHRRIAIAHSMYRQGATSTNVRSGRSWTPHPLLRSAVGDALRCRGEVCACKCSLETSAPASFVPLGPPPCATPSKRPDLGSGLALWSASRDFMMLYHAMPAAATARPPSFLIDMCCASTSRVKRTCTWRTAGMRSASGLGTAMARPAGRRCRREDEPTRARAKRA